MNMIRSALAPTSPASGCTLTGSGPTDQAARLLGPPNALRVVWLVVLMGRLPLGAIPATYGSLAKTDRSFTRARARDALSSGRPTPWHLRRAERQQCHPGAAEHGPSLTKLHHVRERVRLPADDRATNERLPVPVPIAGQIERGSNAREQRRVRRGI